MSWTIFFGIVGVVGVALTIVLFWLGQRDPHPSHHINATSIVDGSGHGPITVLYQGAAVPRVSRAQVVFWNRGQGSLRRQDISAEHPVAFVMGGSLLDAPELVAVSREDCEIAVSQASDDPAKVIVDFHHLNALDGCAFEVLHTGPPGEPIVRTGGIARTRAVIGKLRPWEVERLHLKLLAIGIGVVVLLASWGLLDAVAVEDPAEAQWWVFPLLLVPIVLAVVAGLGTYRLLTPRLLGRKVGWPPWAPEEWFYPYRGA